MGEKSICQQHLYCRVCGGNGMIEYLDLGLLPLANNLKPTSESAKDADRYPLQVMFCPECGLSQLSVVVDPEEMFSNYAYRSGINQGYINHCWRMAKSLIAKFGLTYDTFHIDIGGNDGTLLKVFKNVLHHKVLNVDPAANLTETAEYSGILCITDFWGDNCLPLIEDKADLITATNIFAHLDHVGAFMRTCKKALSPEGIIVIENPYLIDFIEDMEFDTVYHEHVTYWSIKPMMELCCDNGMKLIDVEKQCIHGGSMRYIISHEESNHIPSQSVAVLSKEERVKGFDKVDRYLNWSRDIKNVIDDFHAKLLELKEQGQSVIAFAASAKGNTLLNSAKIDSNLISCIIDETPDKIGMFYPGTGIPILAIRNIMKILPDYIVILSWNFQKEIIDKIKLLGYKGSFIIPIPAFSVVE